MIPLLGRDAVRAIDADAAQRLGLPTLLLMENAGRGAFDVLAARFAGALSNVVIVCGPGQNGGDGFVVARHLLNAGRAPRVFLVGEPGRVRGDALVNLRALERMGSICHELPGDALGPLVAALENATLVVDALFGTGLDRPLGGAVAAVVELINTCGAKVVALDLPSGVDADSGAVLGVGIQADLTLTFAAHKRGLHQHPGAALAYEVKLLPIGVPIPHDAEVSLIETSDVASLLRTREADAHKGSAGHVLVIAGAPGRTGAALLAGLGALRAGAGLCTLAGRASAREALDAKVVELMTAELPLDADAGFAAALALCGTMRSAVVGPGLGLDAAARSLCEQLALGLPVPTVVDADALTALGTDCARLRDATGPRVLTPHPGEAASLLGSSSREVQADRYASAAALAQRTGQVVVLKGALSIVAEPSGRMRVCPTGTPAMAVAGTGDVLSGVIGALLATLDPFDAATAGAFLHGLAGEIAAHADRGLLASELATALPAALSRCRV